MVKLVDRGQAVTIGQPDLSFKLNKFLAYTFSENFIVIDSKIPKLLLGSLFLNRNDD